VICRPPRGAGKIGLRNAAPGYAITGQIPAFGYMQGILDGLHVIFRSAVEKAQLVLRFIPS
jgi:D-mannonate dehydratase